MKYDYYKLEDGKINLYEKDYECPVATLTFEDILAKAEFEKI